LRIAQPLEETMSIDRTQLVERYIASWNETDPARRRALIAATWTEEALYLDPLMRGEGHDGIDAMIAAVQQRFPGHRFRRTGQVDSHNDRVRFGWSLGPEHGPALAAGLDVGVIAGDGRLRSITGFLDSLPAAA
jgi:hypothetical protein